VARRLALQKFSEYGKDSGVGWSAVVIGTEVLC
jgi:hypothetical protein